MLCTTTSQAEKAKKKEKAKKASQKKASQPLRLHNSFIAAVTGKTSTAY